MKIKHYLTLDDAEFLLTRAQQFAFDKKLDVSIAVVDETGCLLAMKRHDGAAPVTANLSIEKAKCSALSRKPSQTFEELVKDGQLGFLTVNSFSGMVEGGEPIIYKGQLVGAVGVAGAESYQDAEIAQHAIQVFLALAD